MFFGKCLFFNGIQHVHCNIGANYRWQVMGVRAQIAESEFAKNKWYSAAL